MTGSKELSRVERETIIYTDNTNKRSFNPFATGDFSELKMRKMVSGHHCNCFCLLKKIINRCYISGEYSNNFNRIVISQYDIVTRLQQLVKGSNSCSTNRDGVCIIAFIKIVVDVVHRRQSWLHVLNELAWTVMKRKFSRNQLNLIRPIISSLSND